MHRWWKFGVISLNFVGIKNIFLTPSRCSFCGKINASLGQGYIMIPILAHIQTTLSPQGESLRGSYFEYVLSKANAR